MAHTFDMPSKGFVEEFFSLVDEAKSVVITSHFSPDDDSIGSTLSVYNLLVDKYPNKKVRPVYTGERSDRYVSFRNYEKIEFVPDMAQSLDDADLLIVLDGSQYSRFTKLPQVLEKFAGKTICIDHHSSPIDTFTLTLIKPSASSTVELIYYCFYEKEGLTPQIAEILLMGLLADTGDFAFLTPANSHVFDIAKRLLDVASVEIQEFKAKYNTISERSFAIIREFIDNTRLKEMAGWPTYMVSHISREFRDKEKYTDNEIKEAGIAYMMHYLRTISGYPWGFIATPKKDGSCSISFRSLPGSINVRSISERMVIGGGHDRAAGGAFKPQGSELVDSEASIGKIEEWMKDNQPILS